jgi:hypothetical protein
MTIFFAWRKTEERQSAIIATSGFEAVYCICFSAAAFYPNTSFNSHPDVDAAFPLGIAPQLFITFIMLTSIALDCHHPCLPSSLVL